MKISTLVLTSFCFGGGVGAFVMWRVSDQRTPGVASANLEPTGIVQQPTAAIPATPANEPRTVSEAPAPPAASNSIVASSDQPSKAFREVEAPAKQNAARQVEKQYGAFLKTLESRGGNSALFHSMLIERQMIVADVIAAARTQGIDMRSQSERKTVGELVRKAVSEFNHEIKTAVGERDYQAWVDSEKMKGEFNVSQELARRLETTAPLHESQQEAFVRTLFETKEASGWKNVRSTVDEDGSPMLVRVIPEEALEKMRGVLRPEQMAQFLDLYEDQKRAMAAAPPGQKGPGPR